MAGQLGYLVKKCKINKQVLPECLSSPQDVDSLRETGDVFRENIRKFKKFSNTVINPITIADLAEEVSAINIKNVDRDKFTQSQFEQPTQG